MSGLFEAKVRARMGAHAAHQACGPAAPPKCTRIPLMRATGPLVRILHTFSKEFRLKNHSPPSARSVHSFSCVPPGRAAINKVING